MKKLSLFILGLILIIGFTARLYRFDSPIADWHSWRQADTSSVSRTFAEEGFNLLYPRYMDLSNVASGKDNPSGYRFVEFPIYNLFQAGLFRTIGIFTLEEWGRLVSIFASLASTVFILLIVRKRINEISAFFAAFFFALLPYSIYYGRTILPDISMAAAILGGIYFFQRWLEKNKLSIFNVHFLLALIFTSSAFLLKPYALFFTLPMIYIAFEKFSFSIFKKWQLWSFLIISVIPLILWRNWMLRFPEGIPVSNWLFNEGNIRFKGAFFRWIFGERMAKLILGYWGLPLMIIGFISNTARKNYLFFLSFVVSSLAYLTVIARGNVQHDYYQILIIPTIAIFMGLGAGYLINSAKSLYERLGRVTLIFIIFSLTFFFSWYQVRDYFNINNRSIVIAGQAVDLLTPKDAKVIASYNGDTSFLYQTKRKGWASMEKSLPEMVEMGASYLVLPNPKKEDYGIGKEFKIIKATSDYILFDLREKP